MPGVGTTHHVEIGGHYYLTRPGSYVKRAAPQFGARFTTGDPDFNNLSFWQHWAQNCFIGGVDQDLFTDDAMYDEGVGVDTTEHEKVTVSRDLSRGSGSNWAAASGGVHAANGMKTFVYNSKLYVLGLASAGDESYLYEYQPGSDGWSRITSMDAKNIRALSVTIFDGKVFIGGVHSTTGVSRVIYDDGALGSWTVLTNPAGVSAGVYSMKTFQSKLYVSFGGAIWRLKDNLTWDGNTVFYKANMGDSSNNIVSMEVHLGFLYMLSGNGHIHRTDGNASFDIWNWDGQTRGQAIRSFDGRLFILTFEYTNTTNVGYGALYQMSGSAMTLLKRWGDETQATIIGNMIVFDRHLFYGASNNLGFGARSGFGVVCYDPIEDAHSIIATNGDTGTFSKGSTPFNNYIVDDQIIFGGFLFAAVRGHGMFKTPYKPRDRTTLLRKYDITSAGGSVASKNGGWFTTSTYDAGTPGVKKLWRKISIDATIVTNTAIVVEYSLDNGTSYTALTGLSTPAARRQYEFFLNNKISTSFKLRITLRTTSGTVSPVFWGFVVSYMPTVEPNWTWSMTLVLSASQQLLDGTTVAVDTEAELNFLSTTFRTKQLVTFTDAEGFRWETTGSPGALIYDITYNLRDLTQPLEGEVTITIMEAVETY